jgi:biotin operon repressor
MKQSPKITGSQLAEILEISTTAVEKHIKQLRESGLIQRVGGTRGYWEVLEKSELS